MAYIVSLLILAFCLYLVITPLLKPKQKTVQVKDIEEEFDGITLPSVYATLNELEMDYNMKKLSDEDYQRLKSEYEHLAAELIAKEKRKDEKTDKNHQNLVKDIESEIEEELAKLRKERGGK
jgi:Fe2+ or Zn2+ uptake regulation protein